MDVQGLHPERVRDKYKEREREAVVEEILLKMEDFGITLQELEEYSSKNVIHLRDKILALRKKANVRRALNNGRRKQETTEDRPTKQGIREETAPDVRTSDSSRNPFS